MLALNVAHLIPDIGNDGVALGFDFRPFRALELLHRWQTVPGGARSELAPAFISRVIEVENGDVPLPVRTAGNENHRDALGLGCLEQLARRLDGSGAAFEDPLVEPARTSRQHLTRTISYEAKIIGDQIRPVGERGLVDIEHKRRLLRLVGVLLDISLRRFEHGRDVDVVVLLVILKQPILDRAEIERRLRGFGKVVFDRAGHASAPASTGLAAIESAAMAATAIIASRNGRG